MSRRAILILVASASIQIALTTIPDTMGDLLEYRLWTRALTTEGLAEAYWPTPPPIDSARFMPPIDYPPLLPYAFWVMGHALQAASPGSVQGNAALLDFLIRLPFVGSSLLLALLAYFETRRIAPGSADAALALVALNPAIVFDTAYWGQADAPCALLITASFVALARGRPAWAWAAIAVAALVKPVAYPFVPLIAFETLRRFGLRELLRAGASAVALVCVAFVPFLGSGHAVDALRELVTQVDAMPYISVNAHNLWWLVGLGTPWTNAYARPFGLLSWNTLSLLLFGAFYLAVLFLLARSREPRSVYVAAATVYFGFFVLATHMHENHLFCALPLLALAGAEWKPARTLLVVLTVTMLANMLLHDPFLTYWARPHTPGPHVLLPPNLDPQLDLQERLTSLGYPWIAPQMRGETSVLGLMATLVNAQVTVLLLAAWVARLWRAGRLDPAGKRSLWPVTRSSWLLAAVFVASTAAPFLDHVLHYQAGRHSLLQVRRPQESRVVAASEESRRERSFRSAPPRGAAVASPAP